MSAPIGLIVDIFAGGGGASVGIQWALGQPVDLGINHDLDALRTHALNHPRTRHIMDDIRKVVPLEATGGQPVDVLWASPDCRDHSRAKGGRPCHPEVRELPWNVVRWTRETRPRLVCVENVDEIRKWGPLYEVHSKGCLCPSRGKDVCPKGCPCEKLEGGCIYHRPIPELIGTTWDAWVQAFRDLGYEVDSWKLRACDYGAPTSRERLFFVARRDGKPQKPEPTHGPGREHPYRTAAECIDWDDLGESIFDEHGNTRHADATLRRIATGIVRFVLQARQPFIVTCNHGGEGFRGQGLTEPFRTLTAAHDAHGLVAPTLIQMGYGERDGQAPRALNIQQPLGTIVAGGPKHALVSAFLAKHYGGVIGHELGRPLGTITSVDHHSVVAANLIRTDNTSDGRLRGLTPMDRPLKTVTTSNGHALVAAFLSTYYGQSVGQRADAPMGTQTTRDRHGLVTLDIDGVTHVMTDIRMRMVQPHELKLAQGLPASYRLEGTKRLQVQLIGNSVPPQLSEAVVRSNTWPQPRGGRLRGAQLALFEAA